MYKKYIHPCYSWYNEQYKQLDDDKFISSKGEVVTLDKINETIKHDVEKVKSGDYKAELDTYGLLDSTEQEFTNKVYDYFEELHKNILETNIKIAKLKHITGIYYEI